MYKAMDPITEKATEALAKMIADDLREALKNTPETTLEQVRAQVEKTLFGSVEVEVDPENPDCVLISWEPPKQICLEVTLDIPPIDP